MDSGVRSAVRLMAAFQATSRRACASMAARAPGLSETPSPSSPLSRAVRTPGPGQEGRQGRAERRTLASNRRSTAHACGGRASTVRPAGKTRQERPLLIGRYATSCEPPMDLTAPAADIRLAPSTFRFSIPRLVHRHGFLRPPSRGRYRTWSGPQPWRRLRWCRAGSLAGRAAGVNGVFPRPGATPRRLWITPRALDLRGGGARRANGSAHAPPHDLHDLFGVGARVSGLDRRRQAAGDVVLHQQQRDGVDRGSQRGRLLEDVDAVLVALDHAGDAPHLPLQPGEPAQELGAILLIAARRGGPLRRCRRGCGCVRHTGWEYSSGALQAWPLNFTVR